MADPLTRLPNRRHFFDALEKTLERHRNAETRFAVGLLDLDGFKLINDLYGHGVGDELLIKTGQRLQEVLAGTVEIARLGGDEFGLIFDDASDPELVMAIAQEICGAMALPFTLSTGRAKVAATLGIAIYPEAAGDAQKLFERADYALYYSKQNSKGAPVLFSEMHRAIIREVASIEQRLYEADLEREMTVFFQPIVEMETGRVIAMEALARWNSPTLGNVAPDSFIRSAEQTGTINHVTRLLIRKALEAAESWPEHVALSFNLSAQDLTEHATLQLAAIIEASEFAPSRLMLEITETAMLRDLETATQALEPLRLLGCKVALDDFGTGYSSLSYLHKMPIDHVKIDRSFVRALGENESATDLLSALHALCSQLKLGCVIEGLETADHVEALMACGYSLAQGFHFARPMRATHAARFLDPARCADAA
jgi:diguanylate cyclase (GGDEF)-like protein